MKWKQAAETLHTIDVEEKIEEMESELGRLMVGLVEKVARTSSKKTSTSISPS
jgi:hypothetical protein